MLPSLQSLAQTARELRECLPMADAIGGHRIGLYGTGFLGDWAVDHLHGLGADPVACFDGDPRKQGQSFKGMPVRAFPDEIALSLDGTLITARHAVGAILPMLQRQGIPAGSFDGWYVANHFDGFLDLHDGLLDDERSRATLRAVLHAMLTGERSLLGEVMERDQYFCLPPFIGAGRERYVDAGAYVGDSIERFIWANGGTFGKIWGFEPFARQFAALSKRCDRLAEEWALPEGAIELNRAGLGARSATMSAASGSGHLQSVALSEDPSGELAVASLDDHLQGEPVSFIKADVEGMEMDLLAGAEKTISTHRPKLAICVYHYPSDMLEIAARIRSYVPDYRFALRHHSPQLMETVLYAWID